MRNIDLKSQHLDVLLPNDREHQEIMERLTFKRHEFDSMPDSQTRFGCEWIPVHVPNFRFRRVQGLPSIVKEVSPIQ